MSKKIYIAVGIIVIAAAAVFVVTREDDPQIKLAKEEILRADSALAGFQNTINAIPALELSQDVKNDFKIQINYLGAIGSIIPDTERQSPKAMEYIEKMAAASDSRGSTKFHIDLDEGLEKISENLAKASGVAGEDLNNLEKLADAFDAQVKLAKSAIPQPAPLTVERNKKTEKYFLEFDRSQQKLDALAATLSNYASAGFKNKIKKLKQANELFGGMAGYTAALIGGKAFGYALDVSKLFPEVKAEEAKVKKCASQPNLAGCGYLGPFPGGYQQMLQKLEPLYSALIEE